MTVQAIERGIRDEAACRSVHFTLSDSRGKKVRESKGINEELS